MCDFMMLQSKMSFVVLILMFCFHNIIGKAMFGKRIIVSEKDLQELELSIPEKCENQTFCDIKSDKYPTRVLNNILNTLFQDFNKNLFLDPAIADRKSFDIRQGNWKDDDCPKSMVNKNIYWHQDKDLKSIIINTELFPQEFEEERCEALNEESYPIIDDAHGDLMQCYSKFGGPHTKKTYCRETRTNINFLALNYSTMELIRVKKEVSLACSCYYDDDDF